jgi:hypothetical protein
MNSTAKAVVNLDGEMLSWNEEIKKMVAKKKSDKKAAKKGRLKTVKLKRETVRDLSGREKKQVKGGGGLAGGVVSQGRVV